MACDKCCGTGIAGIDGEYGGFLVCECRKSAQAREAVVNDIEATFDSAVPVSEYRVVDPTTGGEKGQKLARFDLIPPEFEWALAEHYGRGARKYEDRNWERGYAYSLSLAALKRHLNLWERGEELDPETGSHHLIAVAWHAIALFTFRLRGIGTDDRVTREREAA